MTSESKISSRLAWSLAVAAIIGVVVALGMGIYYISAGGDRGSIVFYAGLTPFVTVAYVIVGALVASRRPQNPIGWIFITVGLLYALNALTVVYYELAVFRTGSDDFIGARPIESWPNSI